MSDKTQSPKGKYSRAAAVRARYGGVSDMWITRKIRDSGFPKPVYLDGRDRFWINEQLDAWEAQAEQSAPKHDGIARKGRAS